MMLKLKLQYFGHLMRSVDSLEDSDAERDWGQEENGMTEDEMAGWHHSLDGLESEWTPGVGDGQGGLACWDSWGQKESDMTEWLNWTELRLGAHMLTNIFFLYQDFYYYIIPFLVVWNSLCLQVIFPSVKIITHTFFPFIFVWNIFFPCRPFSLFVPLALKWISHRQHTEGSFRKSSQLPCVFWLEHLVNWHLK